MHLSKDSDNKIKRGRVWLYLNESYSKNIGIEWSLRINPFNFYAKFDGGERDYTFCFWFIWVFYIKFSNIFKKYPKEWNSQTNNKKGGYLDSAERTIGISQYGWNHISLYLWHDGENSWEPDKDKKLWYKIIWLEDIFIGSHKYHTIEEKIYDDYIDLTEGQQKINIQYRFWDKQYKRFYMKMFNHKGKAIQIKSKIKYPSRKETQDDRDERKVCDIPPDELERTMGGYKERGEWYSLKETQDVSEAIKQYKEKIYKLRSCEVDNWVPYEYRKNYYREEKLKRILDE
jgi:hypothetical protein